MGQQCASCSPQFMSQDQKEDAGKSKLIEKQNREEALADSDRIKLLLLGIGESGKSTIFKQMRLLYGQGFSEEEVNRYKWTIRSNIIESIQNGFTFYFVVRIDVVIACEAANRFGYCNELTDKIVLAAIELIRNARRDDISPEMKDSLLIVWNQPFMKKTLTRQNEFQVFNDSIKCDVFFKIIFGSYFSLALQMSTSLFIFMSQLDTICSPQYTPSQQDMLLCRMQTTGFSETKFLMQRKQFILVDVGGQKSERRKWIHWSGVLVSNFNVLLFRFCPPPPAPV
jgi:hypothetical protein